MPFSRRLTRWLPSCDLVLVKSFSYELPWWEGRRERGCEGDLSNKLMGALTGGDIEGMGWSSMFS